VSGCTSAGIENVTLSSDEMYILDGITGNEYDSVFVGLSFPGSGILFNDRNKFG
jgi:hypothetical protein